MPLLQILSFKKFCSEMGKQFYRQNGAFSLRGLKIKSFNYIASFIIQIFSFILSEIPIAHIYIDFRILGKTIFLIYFYMLMF